MTSKDQLLPCPFCGGEAQHSDIGNDHTKSRATKIWCTQCHFKKQVGAIRNSLDWTREQAIAAWNRRSAKVDAVQVRNDAYDRAANVIELYDDATMRGDYMLDADECAEIIRALKSSPVAAMPPEQKDDQ